MPQGAILPPYKWPSPCLLGGEHRLPAAGETLDEGTEGPPMVKNGRYMVSTTNYCLICG